jgi:hypothetical protein
LEDFIRGTISTIPVQVIVPQKIFILKKVPESESHRLIHFYILGEESNIGLFFVVVTGKDWS